MSKSTDNRWLLPDGIEEVLPPDAARIEALRQRILGLYHSWGYDMVMPAMIEFTDSLLTGTAHSLNHKTFTLVDQQTGRQLGVRSDMTPQVARIDAHQLASQGTSRLCYCGHLLHAQTDGLNPSRSPLQIGAEIFGNDSIEADIEVVWLMLETLATIPLNQVSIDLGHVGLFRSLFEKSNLDKSSEPRLFDMLQRKSIPELRDFLQSQDISSEQQKQFCQLALLNGDVGIIEQAREIYASVGEECLAALDTIEAVAKGIHERYPDVLIHCDLSELRGYEYHTGLVFAAFLPGQGREIARGGRYDDIGEVFGMARPATGFSADLLNLYQLSDLDRSEQPGILAPGIQDSSLAELIKDLRGQGERVKVDITAGAQNADEQGCDRVIRHVDGQWVVEKTGSQS